MLDNVRCSSVFSIFLLWLQAVKSFHAPKVEKILDFLCEKCKNSFLQYNFAPLSRKTEGIGPETSWQPGSAGCYNLPQRRGMIRSQLHLHLSL